MGIVTRGAVGVAALVLGTSGCSGDGGVKTEIEVDAPYYETVDDLAARADIVLEATVVSLREDVEYPKYDSTDPRVNPYAGTGREPTEAEIREGAVPVTITSMEVLQTHYVSSEGRAPFDGSVVEVVEPGGFIGEALAHGADPSQAGETLLIFALVDSEGRYHVLGAGQGRLVSEEGLFVSVVPERSDLRIGSSDIGGLEFDREIEGG